MKVNNVVIIMSIFLLVVYVSNISRVRLQYQTRHTKPSPLSCEENWNLELCRMFQNSVKPYHHPSKSAIIAAVMIESRYDEAEKRFPIVLPSVFRSLVKMIDIHVMVTREIIESPIVRPLLLSKKGVHLHQLVRNMTIFDYNALLTLPIFWQFFQQQGYTHVLLFEADSYFCGPNTTQQVEDYINKYVFVGAPWSNQQFSARCVGGNTGLSLWNVSTIEMLTRTKIIGHMNEDDVAVDKFFAHQFEKHLHPSLFPTCDMAKKFSIESDYDGTFTPIGTHQGFGWTKTYRQKHGDRSVNELLKRCPGLMQQPHVKQQTIDEKLSQQER